MKELKLTLLATKLGVEEWKGELFINNELVFECILPPSAMNREQTFRRLSREFDKARYGG